MKTADYVAGVASRFDDVTALRADVLAACASDSPEDEPALHLLQAAIRELCDWCGFEVLPPDGDEDEC